MVWWSRHSDRTGERTWHVVLACLAAATGLAVASAANSMVGLIAALTLVNIGISCAKPPLWSMPTMFLSGAAAATGNATINSIGNLGGFVGPVMIGWIKDRSGSFAGGLWFVAGLLVFCRFNADSFHAPSRAALRPCGPLACEWKAFFPSTKQPPLILRSTSWKRKLPFSPHGHNGQIHGLHWQAFAPRRESQTGRSAHARNQSLGKVCL